MLKKLFGKKNQEAHTDQAGMSEQIKSSGVGPMPPLSDFYHSGMPPMPASVLSGKAAGGFGMPPFAPPPFLSIHSPQSLRSAYSPPAAAEPISNMDAAVVSPEQMMLCRHQALQEKMQSGMQIDSDMLLELEESRPSEVLMEEKESESSVFNGFEHRLLELEDQEIYGMRVNGINYGYHFGFHDPKCEIPAYQKEKVQMNHVRIGKMSGRVVALHVWCDEKEGEQQRTETVYARLEKIDALILYASQILHETETEKEWKSELIAEQNQDSFKLHTLNETYPLEKIRCDSDVFGQIQVDYKLVGMGTDDVVLEYVFKQRTAGETASIQQERLKIYIPIDKVVSIEMK